eukprot:2479638-Pyramimonas_sp.AAC.1
MGRTFHGIACRAWASKYALALMSEKKVHTSVRRPSVGHGAPGGSSQPGRCHSLQHPQLSGHSPGNPP